MSEQEMQETGEHAPKRQSLIVKIAQRYSVDPDKMLATLKATAFRQRDNKEITNEQMMALMVVADQYKLNPFTKEIFAFPDKTGIVPVVGVDGWSRIINENPELDGIEFKYSEATKLHKGKTVHDWIECVIRRKDRSEPIVVREFFDEVVRDLSYSSPWDTHPNRMHRHKALIQCARLAFGFAGIYDQDEAERVIEMGDAEVVGKDFTTTRPSRTVIPEDIMNKVHDETLMAIENNNPVALSQAWVGFSVDEQAELNRMFNSAQRTRINKLRAMVKPASTAVSAEDTATETEQKSEE